MMALFGALKQEVGGLLRSMALEETVVGDGWRAFRGTCRRKRILLVQTGMGRERAEAASSQALDRFPVAGVVSFGFAGALVPELAVGDTVLVSRLGSESMDRGNVYLYADARLLAAARSALDEGGHRPVLGSGVTVNRVVAGAARKRELGMATGAHTVDMESYWIGQVAAARHLPFLALRAVSDDLTQTIPSFGQLLDPDGKWLWGSGFAHLLSHPGELRALASAAVNAMRAGRRLTRCLCTLVGAI